MTAHSAPLYVSNRQAGIQSKTRPIIHRMFDIEGTLAVHRRNAVVAEISASARQIFLNWLKSKTYIPAEGFEGQSFVTQPQYGYVPAEGIALEGQWAVQLVDDDRQVPGRKWVTEFFLDYRDAPARCCIRQSVSQRTFLGSAVPDMPSVPMLPRFVRQLCDEVGLFDGNHGFIPEPWEIEGEQNFEEFYRLLIDPLRTRPILALTHSKRTQNTLLDAQWLAHHTLGIAHVVVLDSSACWKMDSRAGRDFTVYDGAVRTYQPGFSAVNDEPYMHQLILSRKIENWAGGAKALQEFLASRLAKACSFALTKSDRLYTFSDFRNQQLIPQQIVGEAIQADFITGATERVQLLERQISTLTEERDFYFQSAIELESEQNQLNKQMEALKADNLSLLQNVREFSQENQRLLHITHHATEGYPKTFDELQSWANRYWGGKLHFASRAFRAVKDAYYHNVELVYQALDLLANEYRSMRLNPGTEAREIYEAKRISLGLDDQPTFTSEAIANEQGDTYFIDWQGRRCLLNAHMKKGNSHEPRYCLRIYYFWCDETEQVVIGWLPSHLRNRQT